MSAIIPFPVRRPQSGHRPIVPQAEHTLDITPLPDGFVKVSVAMPAAAFNTFMETWRARLAVEQIKA